MSLNMYTTRRTIKNCKIVENLIVRLILAKNRTASLLNRFVLFKINDNKPVH